MEKSWKDYRGKDGLCYCCKFVEIFMSISGVKIQITDYFFYRAKFCYTIHVYKLNSKNLFVIQLLVLILSKQGPIFLPTIIFA